MPILLPLYHIVDCGVTLVCLTAQSPVAESTAQRSTASSGGGTHSSTTTLNSSASILARTAWHTLTHPSGCPTAAACGGAAVAAAAAAGIKPGQQAIVPFSISPAAALDAFVAYQKACCFNLHAGDLLASAYSLQPAFLPFYLFEAVISAQAKATLGRRVDK